MNDAKAIQKVIRAASEAEEAAEQRMAACLRANGWVRTSGTPGCYWMWAKEFHGHRFTYHKTADALQAEHYMLIYGKHVNWAATEPPPADKLLSDLVDAFDRAKPGSVGLAMADVIERARQHLEGRAK